MSDNNPIRAYIELTTQAKAVRARLDGWAKIISNVSDRLRTDPERFGFVGIPSHGLPASALAYHQVNSNAADWPTAEQIQQTLSEWHKLGGEVRAAWNAIPGSDQTMLQRPDSAGIPKSPADHRR
jgi:hypothetical protein